MEEFVNLWGLGNGVNLIDDRRTKGILMKVKEDLKDGCPDVRPSAIVSARFWKSIYQMMSSTEPDNACMWSCVEILDEVAHIPDTRDLLVNSLHFVPLIGESALKINKKQEKKRPKILGLLEKLTENYTRTVDEFVFARLIKQLVQFVLAEGDHALSTLSLSILVNLCKRNRSAAHHLVHQIDMSQFTATLNGFDVLGVRMNLILAHYTNDEEAIMRAKQTNIFIMIVSQLTDAVQTSNIKAIGYLSSLLHEIHEYTINDPVDLKALHNNIQPAIEQVIGLLEATLQKAPSSLYMVERILGLIDALLLVSSKSFLSYYDRLMNAALKVVDDHSEHLASAVALDTIRSALTHEPTIASTFCDKCVASIQRLLTRLQPGEWEPCTAMFVALFNLLDSLLLAAPATALNLVAADAFDGIWAPLTDLRVSPLDLESDALRMHLFALHLLVRCTERDPDNGARSNVVAKLMSNTAIHFLLARANNSGVYEMKRLVFGIAHSQYFPTTDICKISSILHRHIPDLAADWPAAPVGASCCALKEPKIARLDQLMRHIQSTIDTSGTVSRSHILELYTHKLLDCDIREKSLQLRLEQALKSVAALSQDLAMQSLEFDRYNSFVHDADTQVERLTVKCEELRNETVTKQKALEQVNSKMEAKLQKGIRDRRDFEQRLAISAAEVMNYKQQIETAQRKADAEVKRFAREAKELQNRNETLVQSIAKFEAVVAEHAAEKLRISAELATKDAQIKKMEATVSEKQSEIEQEQAIREQILSLMGKKK